ncbi:MAG: HD domain-containing protein [Clostridiales bacterium]|jgi:putative nucleotidyltransferase with HDIG domain|nr:HD domain-containing protein [Clostridiales bacterium]
MLDVNTQITDELLRQVDVMNLIAQFQNLSEKCTHSHRVAELCRKIGIAMGFAVDELEVLYACGLFHDIGKDSIDKNILNKKEPLTLTEWVEIKKHPSIGYSILNMYDATKGIAEYVLYHHERYDGSGYPMGLMEEEIPLHSRIISVADSYDAMTNYRCYKKTLDKEMAIAELTNNVMTQFDPYIVDVFIRKVL